MYRYQYPYIYSIRSAPDFAGYPAKLKAEYRISGVAEQLPDVQLLSLLIGTVANCF